MKFIVGVSRSDLEGLQATLTQEIAASHGWSGIMDLWCVGESIHMAAVVGAEIVGAVTICDFSEGFCELHKLYVAPNYRRRDIARRLVGEVERLACEREWFEIGIEISGGSKPFWLQYLNGRTVEVHPDDKVIINTQSR